MNFKKIKFLTLSIIFLGIIFLSKFIFAYDETVVHPTLTEEAGKLYNLNFDDDLTDEEISWIKQGSIDEDKIWGGIRQIRSSNHFYNPSGITEWKDSNLDDNISAYFSSGIGNGSKKWAHDSVAQSQYIGGDFTWERAIYDYANGDKKHAYESLGHILHLIEDKTVPAHTRNDFHLSPPELEAYQSWLVIRNFVDYEPYEAWTGSQAKSEELKFDFADSLWKENKKPIILNNLDEYFDNVSGYSNNNFFSKDTIYEYSAPNNNIVEGKEKNLNGDIVDYVYGYDEYNNKFKLALLQRVKNDIKLEGEKIYTLRDLETEIKNKIYSDYWSRLAPKSILAGAGIINLFKIEAEKAKQNPSGVQKPPTVVTYYVTDPINKKTNEVKSSALALFNWSKTAVAISAEKAGNFLNSRVSAISRYFNSTAKAELKFNVSDPLSKGAYSVEEIIKQIETMPAMKAQAAIDPVYSAKLTISVIQKISFAPGEEMALTAQIKNTGNIAWQGDRISLNIYSSESANFYHSSWLTKSRPASLGKTIIAPGETGAFIFLAVAPQASGDYFFRARAVRQGENNEFKWLGDDILSWRVRVEAPKIAIAEEAIIAAPPEDKEQAFDPKNPGEEIFPPEEAAPTADEAIEKEKAEKEAFAMAEAERLKNEEAARLAEAEAARLKEEEELIMRRRRAWAIMPPETAIIGFPANPSSETSASFKFSSSKGNFFFDCSLDEAEFSDCNETAIYENLAAGAHILKVRAKDEFGNLDEIPAEYSWQIEIAAIAPENITDFRAESMPGNARGAILSWTAPYGALGNPSNLVYDIRYSLSEINSESDFNSAVFVSELFEHNYNDLISKVKSAGQPESLLIYVLSWNPNDGNDFYFAIKTKDIVSGLESGISRAFYSIQIAEF